MECEAMVRRRSLLMRESSSECVKGSSSITQMTPGSHSQIALREIHLLKGGSNTELILHICGISSFFVSSGGVPLAGFWDRLRYFPLKVGPPGGG